MNSLGHYLGRLYGKETNREREKETKVIWVSASQVDLRLTETAPH